MTAVRWLLVAVVLVCQARPGCVPNGPCYPVEGIVNAASFESGSLAPNTIATIFGTGLSYSTRAVGWSDLQDGSLPTLLPGTGVRVFFNGIPSYLYYVSPTQINFLVPSHLLAGTEVDIFVVREGWAGPLARVPLAEAAPALFLVDAETIVATRADFSVITWEEQARPGEEVILWATGLGPTLPPFYYGKLPDQAAPLANLDKFRVLIDGQPLAPDRLSYAGVAPGYAGLYQINLQLPEELAENPEIQLAVGEQVSPLGVRLPVSRTKD